MTVEIRRRIGFDELLNQAQKREITKDWIEDKSDLRGILGESESCKSWEFFNITVNWDEEYIELPGDFNAKHASKVIRTYLDIVDGNPIFITNHITDNDRAILDEVFKYINIVTHDEWDEAKSYDNHTSEHRGADDGTYDYAGSFVEGILAILEEMEVK